MKKRTKTVNPTNNMASKKYPACVQYFGVVFSTLAVRFAKTLPEQVPEMFATPVVVHLLYQRYSCGTLTTISWLSNRNTIPITCLSEEKRGRKNGEGREKKEM